MRKLRLDPETLKVESFASTVDPEERGTVHAHTDLLCGEPSVFGSCTEGQVTCQETCGQAASCGYEPCGTYWEGCRGFISFFPDPCVAPG